MHKSYQSVLPSSNKLLKKRWDDTYYNEHRRLVSYLAARRFTAAGCIGEDGEAHGGHQRSKATSTRDQQAEERAGVITSCRVHGVVMSHFIRKLCYHQILRLWYLILLVQISVTIY